LSLRFKNFLKTSLYRAIDTFVFPNKKIKRNTILIIKSDAIGDYILFRNFLRCLKEDRKYGQYSITLIGNLRFKDIAEKLDSGYVDRFIWINVDKFLTNFFYRHRTFQKVITNSYEVVINPSFSRDFYLSDSIVRTVYSQTKIGFDCSLINISKYEKKISDKYYTQLICSKKEFMFEFLRYLEFFERFLKKNIEITKPIIEISKSELTIQTSKNYAVIAIGANASFRKWSIEKFAKVAMFLKSQYGLEIILCGAKEDLRDSVMFKEKFKSNFINLVNKISFVELIELIKNSKFVISNETSIPHVNVALNIRNFLVISNGNHYGRFSPYPKSIFKNYNIVLPNEIEDLSYANRKKIYFNGSDLDINNISIEKVISKIKEII